MRATPTLFAAAALLVAGATSGCGSSPSHPSCPSGGVLYLSWTLGNLDATAASCSAAHVDHLTLEMQTACGAVEIDPIPCISGAHWEYDHLPEGDAYVTLSAVDARNDVVREGATAVTLTTTRPDTPAPIVLQ